MRNTNLIYFLNNRKLGCITYLIPTSIHIVSTYATRIQLNSSNPLSEIGSEDGTKHCRFPISKRRTEEEQEEKKEMRTEVMRGTEPAGCLPNPDHQVGISLGESSAPPANVCGVLVFYADVQTVVLTAKI